MNDIFFFFNGQAFEQKSDESVEMQVWRNQPHQYRCNRTLAAVEEATLPLASIVHKYAPPIAAIALGENCRVMKKTSFYNIEGVEYVVYCMTYNTDATPVFPTVSVLPSDAFFANFRAIVIDTDGTVELCAPSTTCSGSYAYRWTEGERPTIGRLLRNERCMVLNDGTIYDIVAHRLGLHDYGAPVFFKPSHDEIAAQFADVLSSDESEPFYVFTDICAACNHCVDKHVGDTMIFKRRVPPTESALVEKDAAFQRFKVCAEPIVVERTPRGILL